MTNPPFPPSASPSAGPSAAPPAGRVAGVVVACVVVVLAVVGGAVLLLRSTSPSSGSDVVSQASAPAAAQGSTAAGPCTYTEEGSPARPVQPPTQADLLTSGTYRVVLETNVGRVVFTSDAARTPCTLTSFRALAASGYYDSSACHRLTTSGISVLQCGDPTGTGRGGPGYVFGDEALEGATYPRGTVAMANRGPGTNGSQFFLVYGDTQLAPDYTPFGRITEGLEVLEKVAAAGSDDSNGPGDGRPRTTVLITAVTVEQV